MKKKKTPVDKEYIKKLLLELADSFGEIEVGRYPNWKLIDSKEIRDKKLEIIKLALPFALSAWARRLPTTTPDESLLHLGILQAIDLYVYKQLKFKKSHDFSPFVWSEVRGLINKEIGINTRYSKAKSVSREERCYHPIDELEYSQEELTAYLNSKYLSKKQHGQLRELLKTIPLVPSLNKTLNGSKAKQLLAEIEKAPKKLSPEFLTDDN